MNTNLKLEELLSKGIKKGQISEKELYKIFEEYDCILTPVTPTVAPMVGESLVHPIKMYQSDAYTVAVNLTGLPAISVPCGLSGSGLPIGMQLIANRFEEEKLFALAGKYEVLRGELGRKAGISWNETV